MRPQRSRPMRRSDTSRACAFSVAVLDFGPRARPVLLVSRFVWGDSKCFSILPGGPVPDARTLGTSMLR